MSRIKAIAAIFETIVGASILAAPVLAPRVRGVAAIRPRDRQL
jgi:hypothetical protein